MYLKRRLQFAWVQKKIWYTQKWAIALFHLIGWFFWFAIPWVRFKSAPPPPRFNRVQDAPPPDLVGVGGINQMDLLAFSDNLLLVFIFYFNIYYLVPKVLFRKGLRPYLLHLACLLVLQIAFSIALHYWLLPGGNYRPVFLLNVFSGIFLILLVGITYHLIAEKIQKDRVEQENENERLRMELGFLRSQISPHFIFNVLNNVISLSRSKPALVEPTLLKLSGIMRYMLYEMKHERISLGQEIRYLHHFIDLQMQRFQDTISVQKSFDGVNPDLMIEPLLLVPFVENAFKHGQFSNGVGDIHISLKTEGNTLHFSAENKISKENTDEIIEPGGIGLANVKRRLNLLYHRQYELETSVTEGVFLVKLKIELQ